MHSAVILGLFQLICSIASGLTASPDGELTNVLGMTRELYLKKAHNNMLEKRPRHPRNIANNENKYLSLLRTLAEKNELNNNVDETVNLENLLRTSIEGKLADKETSTAKPNDIDIEAQIMDLIVAKSELGKDYIYKVLQKLKTILSQNKDLVSFTKADILTFLEKVFHQKADEDKPVPQAALRAIDNNGYYILENVDE